MAANPVLFYIGGDSPTDFNNYGTNNYETTNYGIGSQTSNLYHQNYQASILNYNQNRNNNQQHQEKPKEPEFNIWLTPYVKKGLPEKIAEKKRRARSSEGNSGSISSCSEDESGNGSSTGSNECVPLHQSTPVKKKSIPKEEKTAIPCQVGERGVFSFGYDIDDLPRAEKEQFLQTVANACYKISGSKEFLGRRDLERGFEKTIRRPGTYLADVIRDIEATQREGAKKEEREVLRQDNKHRFDVLFKEDGYKLNNLILKEFKDLYIRECPGGPPNTPANASPVMSSFNLDESITSLLKDKLDEAISDLFKDKVDEKDKNVIEKLKKVMAQGVPSLDFFQKMNPDLLRLVMVPIIQHLPESYWPITWGEDEKGTTTLDLTYVDIFPEVRSMLFNEVLFIAGKRPITVEELNICFTQAFTAYRKRF